MRFSWTKQSTPSMQRSVYLTIPPAQAIDVEFSDVCYNVHLGFSGKETRRILNNVSGNFNSGELTAIMGPSGAGKSSLLHILTGFIKNGVEGSIKCNGRAMSGAGGGSGFRKEACYIMQENYLQPYFTVNELMMISANLKLGFSLPMKAKKMLVEDTLDTLSLSACGNTKCSKLSGGQAKRLSIALELVDNPPVMFLDEPTTGLDSVSSLQCMKLLKALARGGRTIICTIHQPCASILDLLDQVYILSKGQCAYQGAASNMLPYLRQFNLECPMYHNPADFLMEVVCGDHGSYDTELFEGAKSESWKKPKESIEQNQQSEERGAEKDKELDKTRTMVLVQTPKEMDRFWILLKCFFIQLYREWTIFQLRIMIHFIIGVLLGLTFIHIGEDGSRVIDNVCFIFIFITYLTYTALIPAAIRFPMVRDVVTKESFNNWYKLKTYFSALVISSLPTQFIYTFVPITVSYFLTSQPMEWIRFMRIVLIYFLCSLSAEGFGFFLGTFCRPTMSTFFGALYIAFLGLFGGLLIFFDHMPRFIAWLSFFSYFSYCFDGVLTALYAYDREKLSCPEEEMYCLLNDPHRVLQELGVSGNMFWLDVLALVFYVLSTRVVTYFCLKKRILTV